jgi:hypothetical protein
MATDPLDEFEEPFSSPGTLFRSVNERIRDLARPTVATTYEFVCECVDRSCFERLALTTAEFDAVVGEEGTFVVLPGHERAGVDRVRAEYERYTLVSRLA